MAGDSAASLVSAFLENPRRARIALAAGAALLDADCEELAVALWTLGDDANGKVRSFKDAAQESGEIRQLSALADAHLRAFLTGLHEQAVDAYAANTGADVVRVRDALWTLTDTREVRFRDPLQRPERFYMPGLPASPVEDDAAFGWMPALEAATATIRREYMATAHAVDALPYIPAGQVPPEWSGLSGSLDWSAIHLYNHATKLPAAALFPETVRALEAVPLVRVDGVPMEVFFSRLKAGAHIPPHHGLTNTRVTVHLPLIVPDGCRIRVANTVHEWREGKAFAFDDSYEHEAWNRSDSPRVVLIFEAHHPDLTAHERNAIEQSYACRQRWLDGRHESLRSWLRANQRGL